MITFPPEFEALPKYPGYFWNTKTDTLFSIKVGGELRELKIREPSKWTFGKRGYELSNKGKRCFLKYSDIKRQCVSNSIMPMEKCYETIRKSNNW